MKVSTTIIRPGYHPLLYYNGLTSDLLKAQLCDGTMYCNKESDIFMKYVERLPSGKFATKKLVLELTILSYNILR